MKKTVIIVLVLLLSLLAACDVDAPQTPNNLSRFEATTAPLPYLLPDATLFAVEINGLAERWSELQSIEPIARFQRELLAAIGIAPDLFMSLAGERVVFALVSTTDGKALLPLALIRASSTAGDSAISALSSGWALVRARNAVWLGLASTLAELEEVAHGDGTSLALSVPIDEAELRLPPGGLARGWVNPAAIRAYVQAQLSDQWLPGLDLIGALLSADLDAIRVLAFRRDIDEGRVVTDAVTLYDVGVLPPEVAQVFDPTAAGPQLPTRLPEDVAVVAAFNPESEACLPWLRYAAARYPSSPLRNLDFWIAEFEERSGHDLERDLFSALGEQGWLLGFPRRNNDAASWLTVLESSNPFLADTVLVALRDWSIEHAWVRTFGLAVPRIRDYAVDGTEVRSVVVRTPFGELAGPAFAAVDGYLLAGTSEYAMRTGLSLVEEGAFAVDAVVSQPHATFELRDNAMVGISEVVRDLTGPGMDTTELAAALATLLAGVSSFTVRVWYEPDGIRLHGEIRLGDK